MKNKHFSGTGEKTSSHFASFYRHIVVITKEYLKELLLKGPVGNPI